MAQRPTWIPPLAPALSLSHCLPSCPSAPAPRRGARARDRPEPLPVAKGASRRPSPRDRDCRGRGLQVPREPGKAGSVSCESATGPCAPSCVRWAWPPLRRLASGPGGRFPRQHRRRSGWETARHPQHVAPVPSSKGPRASLQGDSPCKPATQQPFPPRLRPHVRGEPRGSLALERGLLIASQTRTAITDADGADQRCWRQRQPQSRPPLAGSPRCPGPARCPAVRPALLGATIGEPPGEATPTRGSQRGQHTCRQGLELLRGVLGVPRGGTGLSGGPGARALGSQVPESRPGAWLGRARLTLFPAWLPHADAACPPPRLPSSSRVRARAQPPGQGPQAVGSDRQRPPSQAAGGQSQGSWAKHLFPVPFTARGAGAEGGSWALRAPASAGGRPHGPLSSRSR